jgi:D-alanyl-lipoteichoic acid acyltransferase DltB (MBOAT superfamily)
MQLSSFLYLVFLFLVLAVNFIFPQKLRWVWLLAASYLFCIYADYKYALVLLVVTAFSYASGRLIERSERRGTKNLFLIAGIVFVIAPLFVTKYLNFSLGILEDVFKVIGAPRDFITLKVLLPLGISFYTIQAISYLLDVYNGVILSEKNVGRYALYLAFFPKLVSGPIERGKALLPQLLQPSPFEYQRMLDGLVRIMWGFFKKLIVADRLGVIVGAVFDAPTDFKSPVILLAVFCFSFQIYIDFSAYCDIAIGSAKILGIDLVENFNAPYFAKSVTEFWRRWHISFSSWLRDYIFTPLNFATRRKRSKFWQYLNILITFLVSGLWHGANYTFAIWGLLHGIFQVIEAATQKIRDKLVKKLSIDRETFGHQFFQVVGTFLLVTFAWIFFRASNIHVAANIIHSIFSLSGITEANAWSLAAIDLPQADQTIMIFGFIVVFLFEAANQKHNLISELNRQPLAFRWMVYLSLIFSVIIFGYFGVYTAQSFIYAGF